MAGLTPIATTSRGLFDAVPVTFLSADASSGDGTITVESIVDISTDNILFIGDLGNEDAEIVHTHASTSPTGSTVTLATNLTFAHSAGTKVSVIDYDQIEISHSSSVGGSKSVLATVDIDADTVETVYKDSTKSSGFYYVRYKNSIDSSYSAYSDPIPYAGYDENQVGEVIDYALRRNGLDTFTDRVDHDFCIDEINACLKYIRGKRKKWHRLQEFDYELGQTEQGEWRFSVPSNMWGYSNKSVLDIHLEGYGSLEYLDEREWNEELDGTVYDTAESGASAGDTTLTLVDSYSFEEPSSGTADAMVGGQEITYTTNTVATGVLSGIPASGTGALTSSVSAGDFVWQGDWEDGEPEYYTVKGGYVYIWPLPDSSYDNINVMLDYWKEAPSIDSDYDTLDVMRYDMVKYWLTWAVWAELRNEGIRSFEHADYVMFADMLRDAMRIEAQASGQEYPMKPKLNKIDF